MAQRAKKLLIVDGYNVLRSGNRYVHMRHDPDYTHDTFNRVREALISDVAAFAGSEYQAVIVFDAAENEESAGKHERVSGVRIVFSPFGASADKVIEKMAHDARARHQEVLVITSDASIQDTVFGGGVTRMSSNGFGDEMVDLAQERRMDTRTAVARKATIADRLDAATRAKLEALRDRKTAE